MVHVFEGFTSLHCCVSERFNPEHLPLPSFYKFPPKQYVLFRLYAGQFPSRPVCHHEPIDNPFVANLSMSFGLKMMIIIIKAENQGMS